MESSTNKRALGLRDKLPDIEKTLDTVKFLKSRKVPARQCQIFPAGNDTDAQPPA